MTPSEFSPPATTESDSRSMIAWTTAGDGIAQLVSSSVPIPVPGRGEVLVKVLAVSLNYRDLLVINGVAAWKPQKPVVPISDAVGIVIATGEGVHRFDVGDRISPLFLPKWRSGPLTPEEDVTPVGGPVNRGMLAEYVVIHEDEAVRSPRTLDDIQAATLPIAAVTAWHAVARRSDVQQGETVLIHGTGGVALFAMQFVLARGGIPIVTSSSEEKLELARNLGATKTINYRTTKNLADEVLKFTNGKGADHVIETVGGENLNHSLRAVKLGGTISFIGLIDGLNANINTYEFVVKNVTIHGIETGSREMFEEMVEFIDEHGIVPVVDSTYPVESVREALSHLQHGGHFGKIVLVESA